MSRVIFTRGLPGSGKSTWARNWVSESSDTPRMEINRDNIRQSMGIYGVGSIQQEEAVSAMQATQFKSAVENGFDVVISDTNLRVRYVKNMVKNAMTHGYDVEFKDFEVSLDELFKRNKNRPENERVSEEVLREMNMKFPYKNWQTMEEIVSAVMEKMDNENKKVSSYTNPFINDMSKPNAILVDIDGTIAHKTHERDWHDYDERVMTDTPDKEIIEMVNTYYHNGYKIIIMSGRQDKCKEFTIQWLNDNNVHFHEIHMRETGDNREDWIIKDELVRAHIENKYYINFCLDDRNQVVNHYRRNGFKVLQVAHGDF